MTDQQHRATDDEWACVKEYNSEISFSCLLELRDRIETLEAPQSGSIDLSHLSDAEREKILKLLANPGRFEVLEVAQPAKPNYPEKPDSSLLSQVSEVANRIRAAAHMQPNYPAKPDSSLVRRVGAEIDNGIACDREPERVARDVIHAVAAWLREQKSYAHGWAIRLELEAEQ